MNKSQCIVIKWLTESELNFIDNFCELAEGFDESETIPDEVYEAYEELSYTEKIEVIKKSASNILKMATT